MIAAEDCTVLHLPREAFIKFLEKKSEHCRLPV
ncbi:cyclic nucleotide-binding domain-containing protein [Hallerella porci]|nr:cyclic nucleotide-binding domain-containing protein [Hallerella porci]